MTASLFKLVDGFRRVIAAANLRAMSGVGGAAAASQLAALLSAPILARLYPADAFGHFGSLLAYCNIVSTILLLGMSDAILAAHNKDTARKLLAAALKLSSALIIPAGLLSATAIRLGWFGLGSLPMAGIALILPLLACLVLASLLQAALVNARRFAPLATSYLTMGWMRAALQIGGGLAGSGYGGLAGGELGGRLAADLVMARRLDVGLRDAWRIPSARWKPTLSAYRKFPLQRSPSAILSALAVGSPVLMITELHGPASAGQFSLMFTMLMGPIAIIQRAIGDVFTGQFGEIYRHDHEAGSRFALIFALLLSLIGIAGGLLLHFAAVPIFVIAFGEQWRMAGEMAFASAPWIAVLLPALPLSQILIVTHRPEFKLAFDIIYVAALAMTYLWGKNTAATPLEFVSILAAVSAAAYLIYFPLFAIALRSPGAVIK